MFIRELNHYNVQVPAGLFPAVREFYRQALGLHDGEHFTGNWLYAGARPVLHLSALAESAASSTGTATGGTGWIDHVAFTCTGLVEARARLDALGVAYVVNDVAVLDLVQLVVHDPAGIKIELQFPGERQYL